MPLALSSPTRITSPHSSLKRTSERCFHCPTPKIPKFPTGPLHSVKCCPLGSHHSRFFSFLRASNLVPKLARSLEGILFLQHVDIKFTNDGAILKVQHSKTNQFGDRKVRIPIPEIPGDDICPVLSLCSLFRIVKCIPTLPAFSFAASCGVPPYFIKLQGDWSSDCYTRYICLSAEQCLMASNLMRDAVHSSL
jgi:hypothetical protein